MKSLKSKKCRGLATAQAADYLGVSEALLRKDRSRSSPNIPYSRVCGRIVYYPELLDSYITAVTRGGPVGAEIKK
jgi:hypothetical protein